MKRVAQTSTHFKDTDCMALPTNWLLAQGYHSFLVAAFESSSTFPIVYFLRGGYSPAPWSGTCLLVDLGLSFAVYHTTCLAMGIRPNLPVKCASAPVSNAYHMQACTTPLTCAFGDSQEVEPSIRSAGNAAGRRLVLPSPTVSGQPVGTDFSFWQPSAEAAVAMAQEADGALGKAFFNVMAQHPGTACMPQPLAMPEPPRPWHTGLAA